MDEALVVELEAEGDSVVAIVVASVVELELLVVFMEGLAAVEEEASGASGRLSRYWSFLLLDLAFMADTPGTIFSMSRAAAFMAEVLPRQHQHGDPLRAHL